MGSGHDKRLPAPRHYPIDRKQRKYVTTIKGSRSRENAIPVSLLLREVLGYAETEKEAKKIVNDGKLLRNGSEIRDIQEGVGILDTVEIPDAEEKYRAVRHGSNLKFVEIDEAGTAAKIVDKKADGDEYVYRLHNGENFRSSKDFDTGNTVLPDDDSQIKLQEGVKVLAIGGNHAGEVAELAEVKKETTNPDTGTVEAEQEFETELKNLVAVDGVDLGDLQ